MSISIETLALAKKYADGGGKGGDYIPVPENPSDGAFLIYNATSGEWQAVVVPEANGEDF